MTHELAGALQQARGIGKLGATKEAHIDVCLEGIHIGKCRDTNTRRRMAIVHQLANISHAVADDRKPMLRDRCQFTWLPVHPGVDSRIVPHRCWKTEEVAHLTSARRVGRQRERPHASARLHAGPKTNHSRTQPNACLCQASSARVAWPSPTKPTSTSMRATAERLLAKRVAGDQGQQQYDPERDLAGNDECVEQVGLIWHVRVGFSDA